MLKRLLFIFNFLTLPRSIIKNWTLLLQMVERNLAARYKGAMLGWVWCFFQPLLMLCVYTFVFSVVFKLRWGAAAGGESRGAFAVIMFCGIALYSIFSECISNNCGVILSNTNYVQKVIFPLEILPLSQVLTSFILGVAWFILLFAGVVLIFGKLSWTMIFILPVLAVLLLFTLGISYIVASLGVYVRDLSYVVQILLQILFFMTPIFYPISAVPPQYRVFLQANPLTILIEEARKVFIYGSLPDWKYLGIAFLVSVLVLQLGFSFFYKTQKGFADVL